MMVETKQISKNGDIYSAFKQKSKPDADMPLVKLFVRPWLNRMLGQLLVAYCQSNSDSGETV